MPQLPSCPSCVPPCRHPPARQHPAVCGCGMHVLTAFGLSAMHEKRRQLLLRQALSASHAHTSAHHRTPLPHTSFPPSLPSLSSLLPFLHFLPSFPTPDLSSISFPRLPSFRPSISFPPSVFVPQYPYLPPSFRPPVSFPLAISFPFFLRSFPKSPSLPPSFLLCLPTSTLLPSFLPSVLFYSAVPSFSQYPSLLIPISQVAGEAAGFVPQPKQRKK